MESYVAQPLSQSKERHHNLNRFYLKSNRPKGMRRQCGRAPKFDRPQLLLDKDGEPAYRYCPSGSVLDGSDGTNVYVLRRRKEAADR